MGREFSKDFYNSKLWKRVRKGILMRDNYICQHCGKPASAVHHIIHLSPENIGDDNITINPENLISLCRDCHFLEHKGEHGLGRITEDNYPYMFDENGNIILKPSHSQK